MEYLRCRDCDNDFMYMEIKPSFYNKHRGDIDMLISDQAYDIVDSIDVALEWSLNDEDAILDLIHCYKFEREGRG